MRKFIFTTMLFVSFFSALGNAWAFPNWIGVYDYYQRHDGGNPGRFQILMNQSYFGLEAKVGYRVNGGAWAEYPMNYAMDVDGNSLWEYVPAQPFPFGATVEFYFHGYDTVPGNDIYDSRDSLNYFSGPLQWKAKEVMPMYSVYPNNNLQPTTYATAGEVMYLAYVYPGINTNLTFARKFPGQDWEWTVTLDQETPYNDLELAAAGSTVVLTYRVDTNLFVRTSADQGSTWGAAILLATIPADGSLASLEATSDGGSSFAVAYGIATNCCGAQRIAVAISTNAGLAWSAPATAVLFTNANEYATGMKFAGNKQGWHLAVRELIQSSTKIMLGISSSNGTSWTVTYLAGDGTAWPDFDIATGTNSALIVADPYYQSHTFVWRSAPGGNWTTQLISRTLESGAQVWLGTDGKDTFHLYRAEDNDASPSVSTYLPTYRTSTDGGVTWSYPRPVDAEKPGINNYISLRRVLGTGPVQHLIWEHNDYVNMFTRMYSYWMQDSAGFTETLTATPQANGQIQIDATNLTAGMTHQLQIAPSPNSSVWSNLATWTQGSTNITVTPSDAGGVYRIQSLY